MPKPRNHDYTIYEKLYPFLKDALLSIALTGLILICQGGYRDLPSPSPDGIATLGTLRHLQIILDGTTSSASIAGKDLIEGGIAPAFALTTMIGYGLFTQAVTHDRIPSVLDSLFTRGCISLFSTINLSIALLLFIGVFFGDTAKSDYLYTALASILISIAAWISTLLSRIYLGHDLSFDELALTVYRNARVAHLSKLYDFNERVRKSWEARENSTSNKKAPGSDALGGKEKSRAQRLELFSPSSYPPWDFNVRKTSSVTTSRLHSVEKPSLNIVTLINPKTGFIFPILFAILFAGLAVVMMIRLIFNSVWPGSSDGFEIEQAAFGFSSFFIVSFVFWAMFVLFFNWIYSLIFKLIILPLALALPLLFTYLYFHDQNLIFTTLIENVLSLVNSTVVLFSSLASWISLIFYLVNKRINPERNRGHILIQQWGLHKFLSKFPKQHI